MKFQAQLKLFLRFELLYMTPITGLGESRGLFGKSFNEDDAQRRLKNRSPAGVFFSACGGGGNQACSVVTLFAIPCENAENEKMAKFT